MAAGLTWVAAPGVLRALDRDTQVVTVERLIAGARRSRHLTVRGVARPDLAITQNSWQTRNGSGVPRSARFSYFVPVVPAGWTADQPIQVIVHTAPQAEDGGAAGLASAASFAGVVSDAPWHGPPEEVRAAFANRARLRIAARAILLEQAPPDDLAESVAPLIGGAVALAVCVAAARSLRRRPAG